MPLISADALAARLDDPTLRIADVRWVLGRPGAGRAAYDAGHIPGAIFVDLDTDLSAPVPGRGRHPLPTPTAFAARLGALGIGTAHTVVAYDDAGGTVAARLWWMLDTLGHPDARVLDGGLAAWRAAGGRLTAEPPAHAPARLVLQDAWHSVITREELAERLGEVDLLDLRAGERYRGEVEPVDPAAGHIPTARNVPATGSLDADGRLLPAADLVARFGSVMAGGRDVVVSCGSGVTACHGALAMRIAGLPTPVLYAGSFSDWSSAGMPVSTGAEPGEASPG